MGIIISRFRKEKTTAVILEGLEEQIQELEKYTLNTQEQKKRFVNSFLGISIGVYVFVFVLLYFFYLPPTWKERIMYLIPLMLFPIVINLLRHLFTWYFQRKLNKNSDKVKTLREKKTQILEQVMDKETYKVALILLERFGDKKMNRPYISGGSQLGVSASRLQRGSSAPSVNTPISRSLEVRTTNSPQLTASTPQRVNAMTPYRSVYRNMQSQPLAQNQLQLTPFNQSQGTQELRRRTPFPIVDSRNRTAFDRIVDAIVGDSPHDRFAMICKQCFAHNGMAPKEEYDYATFRCAFCNTLNPAQKTRPIAPRLSLDPNQEAIDQHSDSSDSSSSDDESDNKVEGNGQEATFPEQTTETTTSVEENNPIKTTNSTASEADDIHAGSEKTSSVAPMEVDDHERELAETDN